MQGVALCVTNLVSAMAQDNLDDFAMCYQKAVERLTRVSQDVCLGQIIILRLMLTLDYSPCQLIFDREFPSDYIYYKVEMSLSPHAAPRVCANHSCSFVIGPNTLASGQAFAAASVLSCPR
jgi:hypothetical protein